MSSNTRDAKLQAFLDAAKESFLAAGLDDRGRACVNRVFDALGEVHPASDKEVQRADPSRHLTKALEPATRAGGDLATLAERLRDLDPQVSWRAGRPGNATASANYNENHVNAMIVGPGGVEERSDVWIGFSMLAPDVRYPDHTHPPEEAYLVLTDGQFRQGDDGEWFTPGVGGSLYNTPGILHAMRSTPSEPLLALWCLPVEAQR